MSYTFFVVASLKPHVDTRLGRNNRFKNDVQYGLLLPPN